MESILDTIPPVALLGDNLIGTLGNREQEKAAIVIIIKAVAARTWKITLTRDEFRDDGFERDGFHLLVKNGWLLPNAHEGEYRLIADFVSTLMAKRPKAFKEHNKMTKLDAVNTIIDDAVGIRLGRPLRDNSAIDHSREIYGHYLKNWNEWFAAEQNLKSVQERKHR